MTRWRRLAPIVSLLIWTGCAGPGSVVPPLALLRPDRPPIVDEDKRITEEGVAWISELVQAYRLNCVALSTLRGESPKQCDQGLR